VVELGVGAGELGSDGRVVSPSGNAEDADYVVAQPGVGLKGRRVGSGTGAGLVLWELDGPLRVVDPGSAGELERVACERGAG
jgi:hypothetical protein